MAIITHEFAAHHLTGLQKILEDTTKLDQFLRKLRKYAKENRSRHTPEDEIDKNQLKIIGDGFETFGEVFIKLCGRLDNRIFIKDFKRLAITDNGVDAVGIDSVNGRTVYIQFKCYSPIEYLTGVESHLDSFVAETAMLIEDTHQKPSTLDMWPRRVVITSAADIHPYTKEAKYRNRVECFPHAVLKRLVDNGTFWNDFQQLVN